VLKEARSGYHVGVGDGNMWISRLQLSTTATITEDHLEKSAKVINKASKSKDKKNSDGPRLNKTNFQSKLLDMMYDALAIDSGAITLTQLEVDNEISICLYLMKGRDIARFMFLAAKLTKRSKGFDIVRRHLMAITGRLRSFPLSGWRAKDVAFMIYSLQGVRGDDVGAKEFLTLITSIVNSSLKSDSGDQAISANGISMILYGLRRMRSDNSEILALLNALVPKIIECKEEFTSQAVGNSLDGLQGMSSDCAEVRAILAALVPKVQGCTEKLNDQAVGNALYGMQGMSSDCPEVNDILSALTPKIQSCRADLSAQAVGNAFYGLQRMSSDSAEVRAILLALAPKVQSCSQIFNAQVIGNTLYGLQGMSDNHPEVRAVLVALAPKIRNCVEELTAQNVGNALYGLHRMSSSSIEVTDVLLELHQKISNCVESFKGQDIGMAIYGLQGMSSNSSTVRTVLSLLAVKVNIFSDRYHFVLMPFWLVRISMEIDFITHYHVVIFIK
jgi:hypothetical protein